MIFALVPLRSKSSTIKKKNIKPLLGRPLVDWLLESLEKAPSIEKIFVATDGAEEKECVQKLNHKKVEIYDRNPENAQDNSATEDLIDEFLEAKKFSPQDLMILGQATSPFTTATHLEDGLKTFKEGSFDSLLSVVRYKKFIWDLNGNPINYDPKKRPRRQNFLGTFVENGAFYISSVDALLKSKNRINGKVGMYEMPPHSAHELDEPDDWIIVEELLKKHRK